MTVADLIALLQSCPNQDAFVSINRQEYHPTGAELDWYASAAHPVWLCSITVDTGGGGDFLDACGAARLRSPAHAVHGFGLRAWRSP